VGQQRQKWSYGVDNIPGDIQGGETGEKNGIGRKRFRERNKGAWIFQCQGGQAGKPCDVFHSGVVETMEEQRLESVQPQSER
jgi:hypothetical protein